MKNLPTGREIGSVGSASTGMAYSSVAASNIFDFTPDVFYLPAVGDDFVYVGDFPFVLTPEGCVLTYGGSARVIIAILAISIVQASAFGDDTRSVAIAHNGDLLGELISSAPALAAGTMALTMSPNGRAYSATSPRRISLSPGDTIQPVCASTALNEVISIQTMSLVVQ